MPYVMRAVRSIRFREFWTEDGQNFVQFPRNVQFMSNISSLSKALLGALY
jgi:hypothetical protein